MTSEPEDKSKTLGVQGQSVAPAGASTDAPADAHAAPAATRAYRAICFDLDGTLLPMDIDEFMGAYFKRIARFAGAHGLDPELFMTALKAGTRAMAMSETDELNDAVFWAEFMRVFGDFGAKESEIRIIADDFYEHDFAHIGDGFCPNPQAARAVEVLREKGYPLVLATMPMFPVRAVRHRLEWAGVDANAFARITSYENSKYVKPRQAYYAETLAALGLRGKDVLMVGNNTVEDLAILDLGADAYLVTDCLLDSVGFDFARVKHGSLAQFASWCESLPPCANPAQNIATGPIAREATERAAAENLVRTVDDAETRAKAEALARDIASH